MKVELILTVENCWNCVKVQVSEYETVVSKWTDLVNGQELQQMEVVSLTMGYVTTYALTIYVTLRLATSCRNPITAPYWCN